MSLPSNKTPTKLSSMLPPPGWLCLWDICNPDIPPVRISLRQKNIYLDSEEPGNPLFDFYERTPELEDRRPVHITLEQVCGGGVELRILTHSDCVILVRNGISYPSAMTGFGLELVHGTFIKLYFKSYERGSFQGPLGLEYFLQEDDFKISSLNFIGTIIHEVKEENESSSEEPNQDVNPTGAEPAKKKQRKIPMKFMDLPEEIHSKILSLLSPNDVLYNVAPTCKKLFTVVWQGVPFRRINLPRETEYTEQELDAFQRMFDSCSPSVVSIDSLSLEESLESYPERLTQFFLRNLGRRAKKLQLRFPYVRRTDIPLGDEREARNVLLQQLQVMGYNPQNANPPVLGAHADFHDYVVAEVFPLVGEQERMVLQQHLDNYWRAVQKTTYLKFFLHKLLPRDCTQLKTLHLTGDFDFSLQENCVFENLEDICIWGNRVNLAAFFGEEGDRVFPKLTSLRLPCDIYSEPELHWKTPPKALKRLRLTDPDKFRFNLVAETLETLEISACGAEPLDNLDGKVGSLKALKHLSCNFYSLFRCCPKKYANMRLIPENVFSLVPISVTFLKIRLEFFRDEFFQLIGERLDRLEYFHLWVSDCDNVTRHGVAKLVALCPLLKGIRIREGPSTKLLLRSDLFDKKFVRHEETWIKLITSIFGQPDSHPTPDFKPRPEELYKDFFKRFKQPRPVFHFYP